MTSSLNRGCLHFKVPFFTPSRSENMLNFILDSPSVFAFGLSLLHASASPPVPSFPGRFRVNGALCRLVVCDQRSVDANRRFGGFSPSKRRHSARQENIDRGVGHFLSQQTQFFGFLQSIPELEVLPSSRIEPPTLKHREKMKPTGGKMADGDFCS